MNFKHQVIAVFAGIGSMLISLAVGWAAPMSVQDLFATKWISQVTLSPDGKRAAFVISENDYTKNQRQSNLYLVSTSNSPGALRQLTNTPGMNSSPTFSPDGKKIAFVSSRGGEVPQIWLIAVDGGEAVQLTRLSTGAAGPMWSPDGKLIAFTSSVFPDCKDEACNAKKVKALQESKVAARVYDQLLFRHWNEWRDDRRSHILVISIEKGMMRDLTPGSADAPPIALGGNPDYSFSPDGKFLAYVKNTDPMVAISTNNDVFEVPVAGGKELRITNSKGNDYSPRYSPDGKYLAYLSMTRPGFEADRPRIMVRERKTGKEAEWSRDFGDHPYNVIWGRDSQSLYFNAPHLGYLEIFSASASGVKQVSQKLYARDLSLSSNGRFLVFADEAADRPPEVYALGVDGKDKRALTQLNAWLKPKLGFEMAEHHWFESEGGKKIHAMLLKPPGFRKEKKYPAVLMIHGGPQEMSGDSFHPRWNLQMLAAEGYVVFSINFHGSLGFGQAFTDAISGDWGGKPFRDIMKGLDYLSHQAYIQPKKICAVGASYGGYMINWIATQTQRFSCLISHAGLFNMESKYGSTEELWFPEWEFKGTPWTNRALYRKWSPHVYADRMKTPLLVIHGQRDYRVPVEQAFQTFTTLQRQGVPSKFLYFPDEDHFVQKPQNIELWWKTMRGWLGKYLH